MTATIAKEFQLRYTNAAERADKVYHGQLRVYADGSADVLCMNGKYGGTLVPQPKTKGPVSRDEAEKVFAKVQKEKEKGGYRPYGTGTTSVLECGPDADPMPDVAQTMQPIPVTDEAHLDALLNDPAWGMSEKIDGWRAQIRVASGQVMGRSRTRKPLALPTTVVSTLADVYAVSSWVFDGELVGDQFHAFDLLRVDDPSWTATPFFARFDTLRQILSVVREDAPIRPVPFVTAAEDKRRLFDALIAAKAEGVVFRRLNAPYVSGKATAGTSVIFKYKFVHYATVRTTAGNAKLRSVGIEVQQDGAWREIGNVTVPANQPIPTPGTLVEVRYRHCSGTPDVPGALFEPVLLGERHDVTEADCTVAQLHFKPASTDPDASDA